ncbi:poly(ADP-ribose) glycohydrolase domain-containing protein [Allofournierella massiliensis]
MRQSGCRIKVASATNPDGGIPSGRSAQEEALCRCSFLFLCLLKDAL